MSWSLVADGTCSFANGNLSGDPGFADPLGDDYRLRADSQALEHGPTPSIGDPCLDLGGPPERGPRFRDHDGDGNAIVDAGADERENDALAPPEVEGLLWQDDRTLTWSAASGVSSYRVYRDDVSKLSYEFLGVLLTTTSTTSLDEPTEPDPGVAWFYLVSGEDGVREGTLGLATCTERCYSSTCHIPQP